MSDQPARLSIRIDCNGARFGPGKAALLAAIGEAGSVTAAAQALGMSYPRALKLADEMNRQFTGPLVDKHHGGAARGGAKLTPLGAQVLAAYEAICATAEKRNAAALTAFASLLKP